MSSECEPRFTRHVHPRNVLVAGWIFLGYIVLLAFASSAPKNEMRPLMRFGVRRIPLAVTYLRRYQSTPEGSGKRLEHVIALRK